MRTPAVSGTFYPRSSEDIKSLVENWSSEIKSKKDSNFKAVISPHAGYRYSGKLAYLALSNLVSADTYIIAGPSHYAIGSPVALSDETWETPLGRIETDIEVLDGLIDPAVFDNTAHSREHSIEVQLPILQLLYSDFKISPITMQFQDRETIKELASSISKIMDDNKNVALIGSSDFTHHESHKNAVKKDKKAIEMIESLDTKAFYEFTRRKDISICGYGPIALCMEVSKSLDMNAEFLDYATSGDITGNKEQVVGYGVLGFS